MLVLPCLLGHSALVLALTTEHQIGILGILSDVSNHSPTPGRTHTALSAPTATSSSVSSSAQPTLSTLRYSTEQPTLTSRTDSAEPTTAKTILASGPSVLPTSVEVNAIDHSGKTWQIVGIVIIAVLFVATSITCAMFFDRLWTFLKDVVCCATRPLDSEQFIPDCEKQCFDNRSLSTLPSDPICRAVPPREESALCTVRARELPWSTDSHDWNSLHRQPSHRNDHTPP